MATEIWVNIGSGNGLLPDGTKPLPEPMLTDHQWSPMTFILGQFHKKCLNHKSLKSVTYLIFHSNFPGANELMAWVLMPTPLRRHGKQQPWHELCTTITRFLTLMREAFKQQRKCKYMYVFSSNKWAQRGLSGGWISCVRPANERRRYNANVVSHWPGACTKWFVGVSYPFTCTRN